MLICQCNICNVFFLKKLEENLHLEKLHFTRSSCAIITIENDLLLELKNLPKQCVFK